MVGVEDARHAQHGVGAEGEGVEVIVVNAPVEHVDALWALRRAHVEHVVPHQQVAALHELHPKPVGKERVLIIGGVELARREQRHHGLARSGGGGDRAQAVEQQVGVVFNRRDAVGGEQIRQQPHHHLAVLQHVGDARGRARVVLQHVELVLAGAHDVDAGDVHPDVMGRAAPRHLRAEMRVAEDKVIGHHAGAQDLAGAVNVREEGVDRLHALHEAAFQQPPFALRDDARDDVERDEALGRVLGSIDREGDADAPEQQFSLAAPGGEHIRRGLPQPCVDFCVDAANVAAAGVHFVPETLFEHKPHPAARARNSRGYDLALARLVPAQQRPKTRQRAPQPRPISLRRGLCAFK